MDNQSNKLAARGFAAAFATSLAESLTEAIRSPLQLKALDTPDTATRQGQPIHYRLTVQGALRGACYVEFYEPQVASLGAEILGWPETASIETQAEALGKVISSAMAGVAASLSPKYGELTFKVDRVADLAFGGMLVVPLTASWLDQSAIQVLLYFDGEFMGSLSPQPDAKNSAEAGRAQVAPANLELVMDVELSVSLRFGQRQLPLRDVLELASGSVIELDRHVDEPVELLLDGKVIARGEAVIVDGNYGLRVTEIPQPIASHRSR